jgi:hypothetical protein
VARPAKWGLRDKITSSEDLPVRRGRLTASIAAVVLAAVAVVPPTTAAEPNQPPVAVDDPGEACGNDQFGGTYPIPEDPTEPVVIALSCAPLANDVDPDGDILVPELVSDATHGTATVWGLPDGTWDQATYMPDDDYSTRDGNLPGGTWVSDSFTYRVTDGQAWSDPATYRLWVAPINDPPSFTPGPSLVEVDADSGTYSGQWATDIDPGPNEDYQHVSFEVVELDVTGVPNLFAVEPAIDDDGVLTFTPASGEVGLAQVTVRAVDDGGVDDWNVGHMLREQPDDTSEDVTFEVVVDTHRPVANDDPTQACSPVPGYFVIEDAADPVFLLGSCNPLANDTDPDGDELTGEVVDEPDHGTLSWETIIVNNVPETWVSYLPEAEWSTGPGDQPGGTWSSDSFTYRVTDGENWSDPGAASIWVGPINDAPTFDFVQEIHVAQDAGPSSVQWATNIDPGPHEEDQNVIFEIVDIPVASNPNLFAVPPAIDENGVLTSRRLCTSPGRSSCWPAPRMTAASRIGTCRSTT